MEQRKGMLIAPGDQDVFLAGDRWESLADDLNIAVEVDGYCSLLAILEAINTKIQGPKVIIQDLERAERVFGDQTTKGQEG